METTRHGSGKVLVIVPAFNEADSVGTVVKDVQAQGYDVLVVDDGSSDETMRVALRAGARVVRLPINQGVGGALRCGFRVAAAGGYDAAIQCDADGQHSADEIAHLLQAAEDRDLDLVVGSRFVDASRSMRVSRIRRVAMLGLARLVRTRTGATFTDPTSGFRLIRQPLLDAFAEAYPHHYLGDTVEALVLASEAGYKCGEVGVTIVERTSGESTASTTASIAYIARVAISIILRSGPRLERRRRPAR